jgi:hypothetical protein
MRDLADRTALSEPGNPTSVLEPAGSGTTTAGPGFDPDVDGPRNPRAIHCAVARGGAPRNTAYVEDKPRYSLRRKSVALTRTQWTIVAVAFAVALIGGPIVMATVGFAAGSLVMSAATLTAVMVLAVGGRFPD